MCWKILFFVASLVLGCKQYLLLIPFIVLKIEIPLKWGSLDLSLCSNISYRSKGNKHHYGFLIYVRFSIYSTACHTTVLKLLPTFAANIHISLQIMTAICGHSERLKFITEIKTMRSTSFVCGIHFWLREVKWLNYSSEITGNNPYIAQRTLIIFEYSKHPQLKAIQNIKLSARFDLLRMLILQRWIYSAVIWKCSTFYMWTQNFMVLKSTHIDQKTSSSKLSEISLNI